MVYIKHLIRTSVVIFWTGIIYLLLLFPYVESYFSSERSLCLYTWADKIDESVISTFERKTGIKVYVNYYESNEELLTKLEMMPYVDCDIIIPSGYIVDRMIQAGLLKKIDKVRCPFLKNIYQEFLSSYFDHNNEYTIPLYWDVLGIGFDKRVIGSSKDISLSLIFERSKVQGRKIGMIDDARESIFLTSCYLNYPLQCFTSEQLDTMCQLMIAQKKWVGAYSDSQQGYFLASETFSIVVSQREYICRKMQHHDFISFALPKEGSLLTVDNVVISSATQKDDLIYQFLNYLYSQKVLLHNCQQFCLLPAVKDTFAQLDQKYIGLPGIEPGGHEFKKVISFNNILSQKEINNFWIKFKAS